MSLSRRPASELPGDPANLQLIYTHGHPAIPYDYEDTLEHWGVSIRFFHDQNTECAGGCTDACEGLKDDGSEVGRLSLWRLRDYTGTDRWMVADAESADLESIASTVLDHDEYSAAFEEAIECPVGDLLILDRVFLTKPWRGFGLGPVFAAEAIRRLSGGCCAVAAEPGMAEWPDNRDDVTDAYRATAKKKIAALWESIGFHTFRNGVQLLDTSLQESDDLLRQRRSDLTELSAAYQAHAGDSPQTEAPETAPRTPTTRTVPQPASGSVKQAAAVPGLSLEHSEPLTAETSLAKLKKAFDVSHWSPSDRAAALRAVAQATPTTDLRNLATQIKDVHFGLRHTWAAALTFPGRVVNLRPFRTDHSLLGPLAGVFVYGSNLNGHYQGRSHSPGGHCQHSRHLDEHTERMTLAQLVAHEAFWEWNGLACSFCRGWSGQRMTPAQHAHYLGVLSDAD
ncbi:hypothetical protein [Streptomyces anulatus]|uniref:hypothetical protein n=1 Tax=Streptomyces anulatus TaxID=1892 RepID=UPI00386F7212